MVMVVYLMLQRKRRNRNQPVLLACWMPNHLQREIFPLWLVSLKSHSLEGLDLNLKSENLEHVLSTSQPK